MNPGNPSAPSTLEESTPSKAEGPAPTRLFRFLGALKSVAYAEHPPETPETAAQRVFDLRIEPALIAIASILAVAVGFFTVFQSVDLYFPADGGFYVGDADALLGRGVRALGLPPFFPAIVGFFRLFVGDIPSFQLSFAAALAFLPISLYAFLRRWFGPVPCFAGTVLGSFSPAIGELIGWGGGPTLLVTDMVVISLAAFEWWIQRGGKRGIVAGGLAGLTALTHPFGFYALVYLLGVRWIAFVVAKRPANRAWTPAGWKGIVSFAVPLAIGFGVALGYYARLKSLSLQSPDLSEGWNILTWSSRETPLPLFLFMLGLLLPLPLAKRSLFVIVASFAVFFFGVPAIVAWDPSYSSRVAYFLPLPLGAGGACLTYLTVETLRSFEPLRTWDIRRWQVALVAVALVSLATVGAVYGTGFPDRVQVATQYYQRLHTDDLPAFDALRAGSGAVATSWVGGFQDEGVVSSWFVEGLSKRPAFGPGAPWLSTLTDVGPAELDMQRFFSGDVGIENGAVQASASPTGGLRDPAIQGNIGGFYYPMVFVNGPTNTYPIPVRTGVPPQRVGNTLEYRHPALTGSGSVLETVSLDGSAVVIEFSLAAGSVTTGDWDVWLWPAYYRPWMTVVATASGYVATQPYRGGSAETAVSATNASAVVRFFEAEPRWGLQAFEFTLHAATSLAIRIAVTGTEPAGSSVAFYDEASLVARYDLTNVLLWNDTGWEGRFDSTPGYSIVMRTPNLIVYAITLSGLFAAKDA